MSEVSAVDQRGHLLLCEDIYASKNCIHQQVVDAYGRINASIGCYERFFVVAGYHLRSGKWRAAVGVFASERRSQSTDLVVDDAGFKFLRKGDVCLLAPRDLECEAVALLDMNDWEDHSCIVHHYDGCFRLAALGIVQEREVQAYQRALGESGCR